MPPLLDRRSLPWVALALAAGLALGFVAPRRAAWPSYAGTYRALAPVVVNVGLDAPEPRQGSGFAIGPQQIVTARHLVVDADEVVVRDIDGNEVIARVVGTDARTDLALLEAYDGELPVALLGSSRGLEVGDTVLAIGNPYGLGHSLAVGVVGSRGRRLAGDADLGLEYLQLTIPLNPGNSGGPLFDERQRVVGVLSGTHTKGQAIAFAVPVEALLETLPALRLGARVSRAFLGVRAELRGEALVVTSTVPAGPADRAGVLAGDRLVSLGGQELRSPEDLRRTLDRLPSTGPVIVRVERGGLPLDLEALPTDRAEVPVAVAGMTLRPAPGTGGRVVALRPRSRAEEAGVRVGDEIRTVNGVPAQAPADVQDLLVGGAPAQLEVVRGGVPLALQLGEAR